MPAISADLIESLSGPDAANLFQLAAPLTGKRIVVAMSGGVDSSVVAALAAASGAVGSVVLGGVGTMAIAAGWFKLFPALAQRDRLASA